jgi:hypothetical protein
MKRTTKEWVRKAEADLLIAQQCSRSKIALHDGVCFHCQQCTEKLLKALLASARPPPHFVGPYASAKSVMACWASDGKCDPDLAIHLPLDASNAGRNAGSLPINSSKRGPMISQPSRSLLASRLAIMLPALAMNSLRLASVLCVLPN